jgi:hypothetical protein
MLSGVSGAEDARAENDSDEEDRHQEKEEKHGDEGTCHRQEKSSHWGVVSGSDQWAI